MMLLSSVPTVTAVGCWEIALGLKALSASRWPHGVPFWRLGGHGNPF